MVGFDACQHPMKCFVQTLIPLLQTRLRFCAFETLQKRYKNDLFCKQLGLVGTEITNGAKNFNKLLIYPFKDNVVTVPNMRKINNNISFLKRHCARENSCTAKR